MQQHVFITPSVTSSTPVRRRHQSSRRQFRDGQCAAALRAITAARLYLNKTVPTLALAAASCGSNVNYVRAAIVILQSEKGNLLSRVLAGNAPLLETARDARRLVDLMRAYRRATPEDLVALGRKVTPDRLFADVIEPVIG